MGTYDAYMHVHTYNVGMHVPTPPTENNQERLVEMGVVPVLVQLLGQTEEASMLLKVVTCLQLLTAENGECSWTGLSYVGSAEVPCWL